MSKFEEEIFDTVKKIKISYKKVKKYFDKIFNMENTYKNICIKWF